MNFTIPKNTWLRMEVEKATKLRSWLNTPNKYFVVPASASYRGYVFDRAVKVPGEYTYNLYEIGKDAPSFTISDNYGSWWVQEVFPDPPAAAAEAPAVPPQLVRADSLPAGTKFTIAGRKMVFTSLGLRPNNPQYVGIEARNLDGAFNPNFQLVFSSTLVQRVS